MLLKLIPSVSYSIVKYKYREDNVGRLVTERSKVLVSSTGEMLPSASGCKEPLSRYVLSFCLLLN